jgi:hypothetical protein
MSVSVAGARPASIQDALQSLADHAPDLAARYQSDRPYPFIIIDDFLPAETAEQVLGVFPPTRSEIWHRYPTADQFNKLDLCHERLMPEPIRRLSHELNSG